MRAEFGGGRGGGGGGGRGGGNTYSAGGGESGYIAPDPLNPNIFYAGSQGALLTRFDRHTNTSRDVQVYPLFFSGESAGSLPERWQWTFPIVFSPLNAGTIYTSSQHLWKSTDEGHSWQKISPDLTRNDPKTLGDSGGPITHDQNGPGDLRDDLHHRALAQRGEYHLDRLRRRADSDHARWQARTGVTSRRRECRTTGASV